MYWAIRFRDFICTGQYDSGTRLCTGQYDPGTRLCTGQ